MAKTNVFTKSSCSDRILFIMFAYQAPEPFTLEGLLKITQGALFTIDEDLKNLKIKRGE